MGYSRAFRNACAVAAVAILSTACDEVPHAWSRSEIEEIAAKHGNPYTYEYYDNIQQRLQKLESETHILRVENAGLRAQLTSLATAHDSLLDTVNHNVRVANSNAQREGYPVSPPN